MVKNLKEYIRVKTKVKDKKLNEAISRIRKVMGLKESWDDSDWYWNKTKNLSSARDKMKISQADSHGTLLKKDIPDVDVSGEPITLEFSNLDPIISNRGNKEQVSDIFSGDLINSFLGKTIMVGDDKGVVVKVDINSNKPTLIKVTVYITTVKHLTYIIEAHSVYGLGKGDRSYLSDRSWKIEILKPNGRIHPLKYDSKLFSDLLIFFLNIYFI